MSQMIKCDKCHVMMYRDSACFMIESADTIIEAEENK